MILSENQTELTERSCPGIQDAKIGQRFKSLMSYETIEKTKSYTMLKIKYIQIDKPLRKF